MFKKILLLIVIISTQAFANKDNVIKNLSPFFGNIDKEDISETPFDGVYEVLLRSPIGSVLISKDGRYLIQGEVIDLDKRQRMPSSNKVNQLKQSLINTINDEDKIIFKAKNEKYAIHVFTDVDCPYCQKLHAEMPKINKFDITVKYLASPLAQLHPKAQSVMEKIWCADDRIKAIDEYKKYKTIPNSKPCDNPVASQLQIATKLGVNGTPAIFLPNGVHIPGYVTAEVLLKRLETLKP